MRLLTSLACLPAILFLSCHSDGKIVRSRAGDEVAATSPDPAKTPDQPPDPGAVPPQESSNKVDSAISMFSPAEAAAVKKSCDDSTKGSVSCMQLAFANVRQNNMKGAFEFYLRACTHAEKGTPGKCREELSAFPGDARGCVEASRLVSQLSAADNSGNWTSGNLLLCACEKDFKLSGEFPACKI